LSNALRLLAFKDGGNKRLGSDHSKILIWLQKGPKTGQFWVLKAPFWGQNGASKKKAFFPASGAGKSLRLLEVGDMAFGRLRFEAKEKQLKLLAL
jgi:hypothetical protein